MNNIVKISNPMLVGAMSLLKKNSKPENYKLFVDELLHATLLAPVLITPPPEVDENGKPRVTKENKMIFPMLKDKGEKRYFAVYTDLNEMREMKMEGYVTVIPVTFKSMAAMAMVAPQGCDGIAINPHNQRETQLLYYKDTSRTLSFEIFGFIKEWELK